MDNLSCTLTSQSLFQPANLWKVWKFIRLQHWLHIFNIATTTTSSSTSVKQSSSCLEVRNAIIGLPNLLMQISISHLAVVIDDGLTWREHVYSLYLKLLSSAMFAIRRISAIGTPEAVLIAYYALFESSMRYGIVLWVALKPWKSVNFSEESSIYRCLEDRESCWRTFADKNILTLVLLFLYKMVPMAGGKGFAKEW